MKHRIVTARLVLAFSIVLSFAACGVGEANMGDTPPAAEKASASKAKEESKVAANKALEEAEAIIVSRWSKLKSIKANILTTSLADAAVGKVDTTTRGTIVYLRRDGQNYFLKDLKTRGTRTPTGHIPRHIDTHANYICSGKACYYVYFNDPKPDKVFKSLVDTVETDFGGQGFFDFLRRNHIPSLLPSKVFEGEKVFVIQAIGKPDTPYVSQIIKAYVSEKTGMVRRIFTEVRGELRELTTTYRNVEVNPTVDPKIFDYTPSVEARVIKKVIAK